jgi:hypothetical protein
VLLVEEGGEARPLAEQRLAAALVELGQLDVAGRLLARIAAQAGHPARAPAFMALARLAPRLDDAADVGDALAHYDRPWLARLDGEPALRARVAYLAGRALYRDERYDEADAMLAEVGGESRWFPRAQLFRGMIAVRARQVLPAARAFQAGIERFDEDERDDVKDLLQLSLARLFYTASVRDAEALSIDERRLSAAIRWWQKIPEDSPYWLTAQLEQSWAFLIAGDYSRTLGLLHTVEAPFFEDHFAHEADILRGLVHFSVCDYDSVTTVVGRSSLAIAQVQRELDEVLRDRDALPQKLRAGLPSASTRMRAVFDAARNEPRTLGYRRLAAKLRREHRRVKDGVRQPTLRRYLLDELGRAARGARRREVGLALRALRAERDVLRKTERDGTKLLIDTTNAMRGLLEQSAGSYTSIGLDDAEWVISADREHVIWPFDGEYWRDELGSYRAIVHSRCRY